ncbi:hypothetical protein [Superficieibacter electus]
MAEWSGEYISPYAEHGKKKRDCSHPFSIHSYLHRLTY